MTPPLTFDSALAQLQALADPDGAQGMAHFGIRAAQALGVSMPDIRQIAKGQRDHELALGLWESGIHEARILAGLVDDPRQVTPEQMDAWAAAFDSWDVCDQCCINLFVKTPYAVERACAWCEQEPEYTRRAGFVMMAVLAVHNKKLPDEVFRSFLPLCVEYATDGRNFVRKAVNWALRQIGKRRPSLRPEVIETLEQIQQIDSPAARWIAADALRELGAR
jgi:3-methyladenine DNA glycosylase AlkD